MQTDYTAVAALSEDEQLSLLQTGDSPERLWAAWALALRRGRSALPTLVSLPNDALTEGLKRQLLVVLAGLGARDLLREIAVADPSTNVRATALANYIRTSGPDDTVSTLEFALEYVDPCHPELVVTILLEHEASRINLPEPVLIACLSEQNVDIRQAAIRCILKNERRSSTARIALLQGLVDEPDEFLRKELLSHLPRADLSLLVDLMTNTSADGITLVLNHLEKKFGTLAWDELKPLTTVSDPSVVDAVLQVVQFPLPNEAIPWIGAAYGELKPETEERYARWRMGNALRRTLSDENVSLMPPQAIRAFLRDIAEDLAYFESASAEELDENDYFLEDAEELRRVAALLSVARRED
jgi:hypothetical protein